MTQYLVLMGYTPVSVNRLLNKHWAAAARIKKGDRELIGQLVRDQCIREPGPEVARRINLYVTLKKGQRAPDPDNCWKVLVDSLVHAGVLRDDAPKWFLQGHLVWARSDDTRMTVVEIIDL